MKVLVTVDMQKDFIDGALGTPEAQAILPAVAEKLENAAPDDVVYFTMDTHNEDYMDTQEGRNLPVPHCIRGTEGWQLDGKLKEYADRYSNNIIEKPCFGSYELVNNIVMLSQMMDIDEIELIGLCTDICVISNAMMLKSALPEITVSVDSSCCAGVTPESHTNALEAMKMCQINIK